MAHIFISYSRENYAFVQRLIADLQRADITIYIDQVGLKPGTPDWEQALRDAIDAAQAVLLIASPDSRKSLYVRDELAIAKAKNKLIYPIWAAGREWIDSIPMGLGRTQYVDARDNCYAIGVQQLVDVLSGTPVELPDMGPVEEVEVKDVPLVKSDTSPRNPYKGLRPFRAEDRSDFFGRSALVAELVEALRGMESGPRFLAVIGPSGSGKSSVVMAGLLPTLQAGQLDGGRDWTYLPPLTPGSQPLENLAIRIAPVLPHRALCTILQDLRDPTTRGLHRLGCEVITQPDERLVLYVDQFEELFTLTQSENERQRFIDVLTTAACEPNGPVVVILTIRADFYHRPLDYAELGTLMETHGRTVLPMTLADLYDVVQKPASLPDVRLSFDEGLVTELVFAVRNEIGGLPLLQFTLDQLFQHRTDHCLTKAAYQDIGGVRGALRKHAEATFEALPSDAHRHMARGLFLRLIDPGTTEQDTTRRRAVIAELNLPDAEKTRLLREVTEAFAAARLLVMGKSEHEITIEVAHEALIREWGRLGTWLRDARGDILIQQDVSRDASVWISRGRKADDDGLYRGLVLQERLDWAARNDPSQDEQAFLDVSQQYERSILDKERRRQRQLQLSWGVALVAIIVFLGILVAIYSMRNQDLRSEVEAFEVRRERILTLAAGGAGFVPFGDGQSPQAVFATATAIAKLNNYQEVTMADEYGVEMVQVPAGCFWMGSITGELHEQPVHEVCFEEPFWVDRYEVSNQQFTSLNGVAAAPPRWENPNQPRTEVTWFEAQRYCRNRDARLPTEAEWEYVARGPDSRVYPWGNEFVGELVVYSETNGEEPCDVGGEFRSDGRSWLGAFDMSGNVWEWVDDWYGEASSLWLEANAASPTAAQTNGLRVIRGGSYINEAVLLRAAHRSKVAPEYRDMTVGFRCVRSSG